jgi:tetratricopeptide (TPR) repeat protein
MSRTLACILSLVPLAAAQGTPPSDGRGPAEPPRGIERERMWPAPTAEDWKKPVLITWQRTWDDAVAVAKETGRPILVCINMDGEIASEHYAGVRYRQPEIAALYEPYVTVIASVYRHNPRDYDDQGRRIPCPRFGGVTCGEHIWIEPVVFEKFCDGQRVAPRHICVELDGGESFDMYYRNDTASVFADIRDGIVNRPPLPPPAVRSDRPILERVQSPDVRDRTAVEAAYRDGDAAQRRALLEAGLAGDPNRQLDLLRLAVFGLDPDLGREARSALTKVDSPDATQLLADALQVPMDGAEREALLATLKRLGDQSPLARYLSVVHGGLTAGSATVDAKAWAEAGAGGTYPAPAPWFGASGLPARIESAAEASEARPEDPAVRLDLAEASLALALKAPATYSDPRTAKMFARHLYDEAQRCARDAEKLGAKGWRLDTILALAAYYGGEIDDAYARADAAVKQLPPGEPGWMSMAVVTVFAESRWKAIKAAVREGKEWPREWLTDLHAAYTVLLHHPLGTDGQVVWHYDFLDWLGANRRASTILRDGLARFHDSPALHERLRERLLKDQGPEALEAAYDAMLKEKDATPTLLPFAGLASTAAAEQHRRAGRFDQAQAAYARAISHYDRGAAANPAGREEADRAVALAHAGRARVALQLGDDAAAVQEINLSLARSPGSAATLDGMGISPAETAQALLARLKGSGNDQLVARLEEALAPIDPELLRPRGE